VSNRRAGRLLADVSNRTAAAAPCGCRSCFSWEQEPRGCGRGSVSASAGNGTVVADTVVAVPVEAAYGQWTQFEEFPSFMDSVKEVRQLDDTHLHWRARVAGKEREWDARIAEQEPNRKITWRSTSGARNDGTVRFEPVEGGSTRVKVEMPSSRTR
jgi:uncharacterized membrane protein